MTWNDAGTSALDGPKAEPGAQAGNPASAAVLIDHILVRYHQGHRRQLPELIRLARKVEQVHGERADCPAGLAEQLCALQQQLESHMQKEEQVLFPLLARGERAMANGPITVMRMEHDQHGEALRQLEGLTRGITLPEGACHAWQALYLGLRSFRDDLLAHIRLENNMLFANTATVRPPRI